MSGAGPFVNRRLRNRHRLRRVVYFRVNYFSRLIEPLFSPERSSYAADPIDIRFRYYKNK